MGLARLALRGTVGTLFVGHGMQKLNGSFGGEGIEATAQTFDKIGHAARKAARDGRRHGRGRGRRAAGRRPVHARPPWPCSRG